MAFDRLEARWMGQGLLPKGVSQVSAEMAPSIPLQSQRESLMPFKQDLMIYTPKGSTRIHSSALMRGTPGSKTVAAIRTATNVDHVLASK